MNNYQKYFENEMKRLENFYSKKEDAQMDWGVFQKMKEPIMGILKIWGEQGHSGGPANFFAPKIAKLIEDMMLFTPYVPIQSIEEFDFAKEVQGLIQSSLFSPVFFNKERNQACYLNAIVWVPKNKDDSFAGTIEYIPSSLYIKSYPWSPKTFYIDIDENEKIIDKKQLDAVWEIYEK